MQNLRPLSGRQKPRTSWPRSKGAVSDWKKSPQDAQNRKNAWRKPHKNMYSYLRDGTLASCGLHVFRDETAIDGGASITQEIREGIASSKLLLAFYSSTYPLSGACQEEIISAWLAAQNADEPPQARVCIINPEPSFNHIPAPLRDLKAYALPHDPAGLTALASAIRVH